MTNEHLPDWITSDVLDNIRAQMNVKTLPLAEWRQLLADIRVLISMFRNMPDIAAPGAVERLEELLNNE